MELFTSASPSAPPREGDDTYDAREREIEGGGDDPPRTLHLSVSRIFFYLLPHALKQIIFSHLFRQPKLQLTNHIGYRSPADRRRA